MSAFCTDEKLDEAALDDTGNSTMDNQGDTDGEIAVSMENEKPASASGSADTTTKGEHRSSLSRRVYACFGN